tara:strand:- start:21714 stop:22622 length:909 start_codon:yes stop_codon:yes gene_type:complete
MRLKFKKSKQKELILTFKQKKKFTWDELAAYLNVKRGALLPWYREELLLPEHIYIKLDKKRQYSKEITQKYEDNWGKSKGGKNSYGSTKTITKPKKSTKLAELIGVILGDGNLNIAKYKNKIKGYSVRIVGHSQDDRDHLINYVKPLFEKLFSLKVKNYMPKNKKALVLNIHSKELVGFLENAGLKNGNKLATQVTIPRWINENKDYLRACLRGLIDTDGCIHQMSKRDPHLLRINFKNFNQKLLYSTREGFIKLGFNPSRITNCNVFYLSRQKEITKYLKEVGFSNEKHKKRLKQFLSPMV